MSEKHHIDIVSFDIPYPANYGGIIDVYNRIVALKHDGWDVTLHCFEYNRSRQSELEKLVEVKYYRRNQSIWQHLSWTPFISKSRFNRNLLQQLRSTNGIVLLEGLHCASYLKHLPNRCYVRTHNIEHQYYDQLYQHATGWEKWYYRLEAIKLKYYEAILSKAKGLLTISSKDQQYFANRFSKVHLVPPVINQSMTVIETEPYVLFSGNLSVLENVEAVEWMLEHVVPQHPQMAFVFAGRNPNELLKQKIVQHGAELVVNPNEAAIRQLQQKARVHLLYSPQKTGLKLKLLEAMACSGHVICNTAFDVVEGLNQVVTMADEPAVINQLLTEYMTKAPSIEDLEKRHHFLEKTFGAPAVMAKLNSIFKSN